MRVIFKLSLLVLFLTTIQICYSATQPAKTKTVAAKRKKTVTSSTVSKKKDVSPVKASAETDSAEADVSADTTSLTGEQSVPIEHDAAYYRRLGDLAAKKGNPEKAMEAYRKCLELSDENDSTNGRIFMSLGKYCFEKKEYGEALKYFSKAGERNAEQLQFKMMLAEALVFTGNNDSAIAVLLPFASNPKLAVQTNRNMFKILGDAYLAKDSIDAAAKWYDRYMKLGGIRTADMAYLAASFQEKISPAQAKLAFEANIKSFPNDYRNYLRLGRMNAKNRATLQNALVLLKKAADLADTIPSIWLEIGKVYGSLGKKDEELEAYRTCLRGDAGNLEAMIRTGSVLLDRGWANDAVNYLEKAYKKAPDSVSVVSALAAAYMKLKNYSSSIDLLIKLKNLQPKNMEARRQLVEAYRATGQEQKAIEEINAALEVERDYELLLAGGELLVKQGRFDDAVVMLEEVISTMPENINALMIMAKAKRGQGKLDEAVEIYKEVVVYDPKYAPALYERAEVHLQQNKIKWAEMFYQRAIEADPQFALAEVGLAKVAQLYKKTDEYYNHLRRAESMAPNDKTVQLEIEKLRNSGK